MTQRYIADESVPPPRPVTVHFTCDGDHGLLMPSIIVLELGPDRPNAWAQATRRGWTIVAGRDLCPECKPKGKRADDLGD